MSGLRDINSRTVGFGRSLYVGKTRGTSQSRLSQIASPPRPRRYGGMVILWLIVVYFGAYLSLYAVVVIHARQTPISQHLPVADRAVVQQETATQNSRKGQQKFQRPNAVPPIQWTPVDQAIGCLMGTADMLLLFVLMRRVYRYNRTVYSKAYQNWENSFMCQRCGQIIGQTVQESSVAVNA